MPCSALNSFQRSLCMTLLTDEGQAGATPHPNPSRFQFVTQDAWARAARRPQETVQGCPLIFQMGTVTPRDVNHVPGSSSQELGPGPAVPGGALAAACALLA